MKTYRIKVTAEQLGTLRDLARGGAPDLADAFDRVLGAGAERPANEGGDEDADGDGRADEVQAHTNAAMAAIASGAMDGHVDPDAALADAAASVEQNDSDADMPAAKRGRRRSPLALWAGTRTEDEEQPVDHHPARAARGRR